jgi:hypothetical protein
MCPNIHPNFSRVKVRTRFPQSDSLEKNRSLFQRKDAIQIFIHCLSRVRFWCALSSMVSTLSEDSAKFPIIGSDLSEYSPNLPSVSHLVSGRWRECSTIFEVKRRKSARMFGTGGSSQPVVVLAKVHAFFGPRMSHFLKVRTLLKGGYSGSLATVGACFSPRVSHLAQGSYPFGPSLLMWCISTMKRG